jgi:hypothetical protein
MARLEAELAERDKEVEHLKAAAAEEGQVLAAVKETMRIHVEGEERLQQQNSALQFQLADQQRLAADLGRSAFVLTSVRIRIRIRRIHMFLGLPDPDSLVRDTNSNPDPDAFSIVNVPSKSNKQINNRIIVVDRIRLELD